MEETFETVDIRQSLVLGRRVEGLYSSEPLFTLEHSERLRHLYMIGKTGTGKSSLLFNMLVQDIAVGHGICLIDPHGDLASSVLDAIPPERGQELVYINPLDLSRPIGFNPLYGVPEDNKAFVADNILASFKHIWADSWGARLEDILLNTLHALLDIDGASLLWIPRFLEDDNFRTIHLRKIKNPIVRNFFIVTFASWNARFKAEALSPVLNKMRRILVDPAIRNMLAQKKNGFDMRFMMDHKRILVVSLPKGKMGEGSAHLLGALLITSITQAAMSRGDIALEAREPFYTYVDEFQNFATDSFATILSEARKYALSLCLANQYTAQLPENLRKAVFGNVGSLISFRVGVDDIGLMSRQFGLDKEDVLADLPNFEAWASVLVSGTPASPFPFNTIEPLDPEHRIGKGLAKNSGIKFGCKRKNVESEIDRFFNF